MKFKFLTAPNLTVSEIYVNFYLFKIKASKGKCI